MKVIGIVGYPASGKGEFSDTAKARGIPVLVMGDVIRREVVSKGLEVNSENTGYAAKELRKRLGMDAVAILTAQDAQKINSDIIIIDGIRGDAEVKYFKSVFDDFTLIYIKASFKTRLQRMKERRRSDDTSTDEALRERDERENSFGLAKAISAADFEIENEGTIEDFKKHICNILGA